MRTQNCPLFRSRLFHHRHSRPYPLQTPDRPPRYRTTCRWFPPSITIRRTAGLIDYWLTWDCSMTPSRFFRPGTAVAGAGVLLAMPALVASGVIECAREVYGNIGPAFFGLRTTIVSLVLMALLRIKRPEGLKERPPDTLGRILGLDHAPEVKTLRRKLKRLAGCGRATQFGRALAECRVAACGATMGFLYVDGHVRVFHGKATLPRPMWLGCACPYPPPRTTGSATQAGSHFLWSPLRPTRAS